MDIWHIWDIRLKLDTAKLNPYKTSQNSLRACLIRKSEKFLSDEGRGFHSKISINFGIERASR